MKDVCNYEGLYKIDENGNVFSVRNNKFLNTTVFPNGYEYVHLCNGKAKTKLLRVHRLVAEAFIPNPNDLPQVNHKDGNKLNNNVDNLEWVTASENQKHSVEVLHKQFHTRKVMCIETKEVFNSLKEITEKTGINYKHISCCCKGKRQTTGGYHWKYID